ncbi:oligoendopeptidase F [Aerococcaceae bacterium WGS1372]
MTTSKEITRDQIDPQYQWDLTPLFETDEEFEKAYAHAVKNLTNISAFEGKLASNAETLGKAIDTLLALSREVSNLGVYAHLKNDQDQTNATYQQMNAKTSQLYSQYSQATAFFRPELLAIDAESLKQMVQSNQRLKELEQFIDDIARHREHVLPAEQELLLASASEIFDGAQNIFGYLNNADLEFPIVKDSNGQDVKLTHGLYGKLLESTDRRVRKDTFESFYKVYQQFENTLAQTLTTEIKTHNFMAKVKGFKSAREASLFRNNVPEAVYDTLVEAVNGRLDLLHRYVELRQKLLKIDNIEMYDMYTPLLGEPPITFNYEEAKEITLKALEPLGEDYLDIINKAFDEQWIDVYENKGKRSGAYSSGTYDSKPYILLNWQDTINSLYTLVHELGHSAHSYLTHSNQPYEYGNYSIFLAEIASTTNENLLTNYLLKTYDDIEIQRYVLNHFLDGLKGTVFRQTQFAEFEHFMHEEDAKGQPLTAQFLSENYQELNAKYYGSAVNSDSAIRNEWSRIPHFYMNYYVFQYATGFAAAAAFADRIAEGDQEALDKYLGFLKSGSSEYAIDTMKTAGLDMTQRDYIEETLDVFEQRLNEFESLLNK